LARVPEKWTPISDQDMRKVKEFGRDGGKAFPPDAF
jgi:hypothetical protein